MKTSRRSCSASRKISGQGYDTGIAADGESGLQMGRTQSWDLILLDAMLPVMDGFDVCSELRRAGVKTPIILLTARSQEAEKVLGLDAGADDYVTKPFSLRELRARVRAHLRRGQASTERVVTFGECVVDLDRAEATCRGRRVELTAQEFRLLEVLLGSDGRVMTRDQLIDAAWGHSTAITDCVVDTHVFNLRKKIEPVPTEPRFLIGVRGLGYRFERRG